MITIKISTFFLFLFFIVIVCHGQDPIKESKVNIQAEIGQHIYGVPISANLEYRIYKTEKMSLYSRAGIAYGVNYFLSRDFNGYEGIGGLASIFFLSGKNKHHFLLETGLYTGVDIAHAVDSRFGDTFYLPIFDIGYRYQKPEGGYFFTIKLAYLGLSFGLGYAF